VTLSNSQSPEQSTNVHRPLNELTFDLAAGISLKVNVGDPAISIDGVQQQSGSLVILSPPDQLTVPIECRDLSFVAMGPANTLCFSWKLVSPIDGSTIEQGFVAGTTSYGEASASFTVQNPDALAVLDVSIGGCELLPAPMVNDSAPLMP
jgi:hypothetical protein